MANIVLSILGNDQTGPATKSATENLSKVQQLAGHAKAAAVAVGAVAGVAVGAILKTGFDEAKDGSAGMAQLEAGVKSTGGAAGVTVGHMEKLAGSIQGMSGQTDDSIVSAEKLLLTFTGIKNSKTDKIFDQATLAAADMAAKMGGDASSNAVRLGKALNDPVKGVSALSKVGVSFTESQKDSIAAMVKHGDTAGAQKVILGELSKEFGGAAKAAGQSLPGQLARAQRSFEDLSQGVVEALLPIMSAVLPTLIAAIKAVAPVLQDVAKGITANKELIPFLVAGIAAVTVVMWALSLTPVALMFAGIVVAIGLVVAAVVLLVTHWSDVVGFFRGIWASVVSWFQGTLNSIGKWWSDTWDGVVGFFRDVLNTAVQLFQNWTLIGIITSHWKQILAGTKTAWTAVTDFIGAIPDKVVGFFTGIGKWLLDAGSDLLNGLIDGGKKGLIALGRWELGIGKAVIGWLSDAAEWLIDTGSDVLHGLAAGAKAGWSAVTSFLGSIPGKITGALSGAGTILLSIGGDVVDGLVNGLRNAWGTVTNAVHNLVNLIPEAARKLLGINSPSKVFAEIGDFLGRGFQQGIDGSASDAIGAMKDLTSKVVDAADASGSRSATESSVITFLRNETASMRDIVKERDVVAVDLKATNDKITALRDAQSSAAATTASAVVDAGNVSTAYTDAASQEGSSQGSSVQGILDNLKQQVSDTYEFKNLLAKLKTEGLDAKSYSQLVADGVDGGLQTARALAAGSPEIVTQMATLQGQLNTAASSLGKVTSKTMYDSAITALKEHARGLSDENDYVGSELSNMQLRVGAKVGTLGVKTGKLMKNAGDDIMSGLKAGLKDGWNKADFDTLFDGLSDSMVKRLKKALGIKSPSTVFRDQIGAMIPAGIVEGITAGVPDVTRSVASMVAIPAYATAPGSTGLPGQYPTSGQGSLVHIDTFNATPEQSPADIAAGLGWLARGGL